MVTEQYKILSLLGTGGFSNVFLAEHRETGDRVALKILNNAEGDLRFGREAAVLQTLECPYTVRLLDFGRSTSGPYMVFELVEGAEDLEQFLERNGPVGWPTAVALLRQMLLSLAEAHEIGIVHRDIKPANMLITPDGGIKVLDFGLVRLSPKLYDVTPLTQTGKVLGTPRYMAPEVLRASEAAKPKCDVFAVGMIGYHLLVGEPPNPGRSAYEVIARHLDQDPYELPTWVEVPFAIRAWIDAMMRKDPRRRIQSATEALQELERRLEDTPAIDKLPPPALRTIQYERDSPDDGGETVLQISAFELGEELGRGATATVWSATHQSFGGDAAVKFLLAGANTAVRNAFFAEARAHARLEHRNIVRLLDYGHVSSDDVAPAETDLGDPYLVMELAVGTLRDAGLPATWTATLEVLRQVLNGLAYAHARGVVHRDIKPENVLCFADATYKLTDFGIAHSLRQSHRGQHETLADSIGTPRYMSPEQFRGHSFDFGPATDLYAFGCVAYELITGQVPFRGNTLVEIAEQHQSETMPPPLPRFDVPAGLSGWLARLLAKRPADRFEAAADASWQLQQLAGGFVDGAADEGTPFAGPREATQLSTETSAALEPGDWLTVIDSGAAADNEEEPPTLALEPEDGAVDPPPMPASWRRDDAGEEPLREGLGLFSLRELPLAGQKEARDVLWNALLRAHSERQLVPVVLDGGAASPVTQLGGWFASRAVEVGAAEAIFVSHTLAGAPREGLAGAIEDMFGTWGLGDDEAAALLRRRLARDTVDDVSTADGQILARELLRARGQRPAGQSSERERFMAIARTLRQRARRRPLVFFVDHLEASSESAAFIRYLLDEHSDLWAVAVLGRRGRSQRTSLQREVDALVEDPRTRHVVVQPYDEDEYAEFVDLLLPLDDALVGVLDAATERDPAMTQLAIADLIDRGLLRQDRAAFAPTRDVDVAEMSPAALIERRVRLLDLGERTRRSLAVCATLGEAPDLNEARLVCGRLDLTMPDGLGARLQDVGLARSSGAGWWFTPGVTKHLSAPLSDAERRRVCQACGEAVLERTAPDDAGSWSRAARFFVDANAAENALEPLYRAVRLLVTRDLETAESLADQRASLLEELELPADAEASIDQHNLLSIIARTRGDRQEAAELMQLAEELATEAAYPRGLARALRDNAALHVDLGSLGEAAARFDRAANISAAAGDALDEAHAWFGAGFVEYRRANLGAAAHHYRAAIARFEEVGADQARARAMSYLSAAYVAAGRFDEARQEATRAQELARSCGALSIVAETKSDLAEIARFTGDFELARKLYEETAHWQQLAGGRSVGAITRLNLALVDLGAGRYETSLEVLDALEDEVRELGLASRLPLIRVARLAAAAGLPDEVDEQLRQSGELFAVSEPDRDIAWAYECGVATAEDLDRQQWFRERSIAEYERLGDEDGAARVAKL